MNRLNIAKLRKSLKMNQETFRKEVGISQSYLSELETGKKILTEDLYNNIVERFGRNIIIPFIEADCDNIANNTPHLECNNKNVIPLFELEAASCGMPSGFEVAIEANKCDRYIIPDLAGCDFTIRTRGRSMINRSHPERSIPERSIVGCRIWRSRSHVRWGEVYALATPDGVVIKKIMPSEKDGYIKCVSFNEEEGFIPYDLPADEIQDWAIVVGVVTVMNWV